jgi:hypothetical protein
LSAVKSTPVAFATSPSTASDPAPTTKSPGCTAASAGVSTRFTATPFSTSMFTARKLSFRRPSIM